MHSRLQENLFFISVQFQAVVSLYFIQCFVYSGLSDVEGSSAEETPSSERDGQHTGGEKPNLTETDDDDDDDKEKDEEKDESEQHAGGKIAKIIDTDDECSRRQTSKKRRRITYTDDDDVDDEQQTGRKRPDGERNKPTADAERTNAKHMKRRWTQYEQQLLFQHFGQDIALKKMPSGTRLAELAKKITRTIPQIRTQVNNYICGKLRPK